MLVKGAWPLSTVLQMRASVWTRSPTNANLKPILAGLSFLEKRKEKKKTAERI
jgi:hypothetical protein